MESNNLEEAKELIEKDRQKRLGEFQMELESLCKKYNCSLSQGQIIIQAN